MTVQLVAPLLALFAAPQDPLAQDVLTSSGQVLHSMGYISTPDDREEFVVGEAGTIQFSTVSYLESPLVRSVDRVVFVECSGAMSASQPGVVGDPNGDGSTGTLLDAVIESILNDSLVGFDEYHFDYRTALGLFGATAHLADMDAAPGLDLDDGFAPNALSIPPVVQSLGLPGPGAEIALHTPIDVPAGANYEALLQNAIAKLAAGTSVDRRELVIFGASEVPSLSDLDDELDVLDGLGVAVQCFALGSSGAALAGPTGTLGHIAAATGGAATWIDAGALDAFTERPDGVVTFVEACFDGCDQESTGEWWQWGGCDDPLCYDPLWQGVGYWDHCLPNEGIDIVDLDVGEHTWSWWALASDGTMAGGSKTITIVPAKEYSLLIGLQPASTPLDLVEPDALLVQYLLALPIEDGASPDFTIPQVPGLQGTEIYMQVVAREYLSSSPDPLQTSRGIELEINAGAANYGIASGIDAWFEGSFRMGETFRIRYAESGN